jgi:hypothetical protein
MPGLAGQNELQFNLRLWGGDCALPDRPRTSTYRVVSVRDITEQTTLRDRPILGDTSTRKQQAECGQRERERERVRIFECRQARVCRVADVGRAGAKTASHAAQTERLLFRQLSLPLTTALGAE